MFLNCRDIIARAFVGVVLTRATDVHERQFADPELERLERVAKPF
jgi:hypothetical protein